MGQRVNIQYSVEIDELQDEINRLFHNAIMELDKVQPVGGAPVVKLGTEGIEQVDSIRQKLTKVDIMLGDLQNIITGYVRFRTQVDDPTSTQDLLPETLPSDLEEKINKLKAMLDAQSNQELKE